MEHIHVQNFLSMSLYSMMAFLCAFLLFPKFIAFVQSYKLTQKIRDGALSGGTAKLFKKLHAHKAGTPTMGGAVVIFSVIVVVIFSRILAYFDLVDHSLLNRGETYLPIFTMIFVGALGLMDDYLNITEKSAQKGLSARVKFWSLFGFAFGAALWFVLKLGYDTIHVPAVGDFYLGWLYFPLFIFVLVGVSNAVNLTDGLDGLAGGLLAISYGVFGLLAYAYGFPILATFCLLVVAALVAFLWFNVPPASVYMGDTGSLALGATLGVIALMIDALFILAIVGVIFVIETVSVMLQLFWKKHFGKKLFLIAPIHHHFEAKGWSETQIVMRFWIIGAGVGVFGLMVGIFGMGI